MHEAHGGGLAGHFGIAKTLEILREHFFWPKMLGDVTNIVGKCVTYHMAKSSFKPDLYSPLSVPVRPWEDVSMDFIVACLVLKEVRMLSWSLVIDFPRWLTLLLVTKRMML